jgi:hypothetical protein
MSSMSDRRWRLTVAVAVLVASACAIDSVEHKSAKPSGARIQMGEGHLNAAGILDDPIGGSLDAYQHRR